MCNSVSSFKLGYFLFTNLHSEIKMPRSARKLPPAMASDSFVCLDALGSSVAVSVSRGLLAMIVACAERPRNQKRNHPLHCEMDTSRLDGVKASLHNGTPRSRQLLLIFHGVGAVDGRHPLDDREY